MQTAGVDRPVPGKSRLGPAAQGRSEPRRAPRKVRGAAQSSSKSRETNSVSTTLENEAIATVENGATQTDWMGDLCGGLGFDSAAGRGRCSAASGRAGSGCRQVDGQAGVGLRRAAEVRPAAGADVVYAV